jgi:hypothetical protein
MHQHGFGHHEPASSTTGPLAQTALLLAHGFGENPAPVGLNNLTQTVVASVTVTPLVTGKFRVTGTAVIFETGIGTTGSLSIGHGLVPVIDYGPQPGVTLDSGGEVQTMIQAEYGSAAIPTTFPVGVPVKINLMAIVSDVTGAPLNVPAHGAQIEVVELPN